MRVYVNGEPVELHATDAQVAPMGDRLIVRVDGQAHTAACVRVGDATLISYLGHQWRVESNPPRSASTGIASGELRAPMPGLIVDVFKSQGDAVAKGDKILVLEAMKTQQSFVAPFDGLVASVAVAPGQQVGDGDLLAVIALVPGEA